MGIDARKEKREKAQSENLLSIIRKEIFLLLSAKWTLVLDFAVICHV